MSENLFQASTAARYIGQPVFYERLVADSWKPVQSELTPAVFAYLFRAKDKVRNIQIELRPVSQITQHEATECFRLAFGRINQREIVAHVLDGKTLSVLSNPIGKPVDLELQISSNGIICGCMKGQGPDDEPVEFSQFINAVGVIDYLDSIGIALRGELESGLGIARPVLATDESIA
ncbi:hypothetical protein WBJ53_08810 [Spirosoma sp. SC4-14]|uniref:hypothetical protein n=1 Tax=Spirosoma sp. SC4-14 TaxID=3128900 RepID=UPI0030CB9686